MVIHHNTSDVLKRNPISFVRFHVDILQNRMTGPIDQAGLRQLASLRQCGKQEAAGR